MNPITFIEQRIFSSFFQYCARHLRGDGSAASVNFRRLWFSNGLNCFGAQITSLALPLCAVLLLHATPEQMGVLVALQALPFALFGLPVLTFLVGRDGLIDAQSKFAATESASRLIGPGLAGVLVQVLSAPVAILCTACGYLVSVFNLRAMSVRDPRPAPSSKHALRDIADGLLFVWREPLLRALAWGAGIWHFLFYASMALTVLFATRDLGMSPGVLGMTQMLGGAGVLLSAFIVKPLTRRYGAGRTILIGLASTSVCFALTPTIPALLLGSAAASAVAYAVLMFFFDCGVMLFFIPYLGLRQKVTPDPMLGRMTSTMRFLTVATAPLGALAAGWVAEHFGVRNGLACIAAGSIALTIAMVWGTPLRSVRT